MKEKVKEKVKKCREREREKIDEEMEKKRDQKKIRNDPMLMQSILTMTDWQCGPLSSRKA